MSQNISDHECDLFLLSSHQPWHASESLREFAFLGKRNIDGWGIGSYLHGQAHVLKSATPALKGRENPDLSPEFRIAMSATCSSTILGHLRLNSRGQTRVENNHPFHLPFLNYDWLLIHNGTSTCKDELVPPEERLFMESDSDTPRVFEFLRRKIIEYFLQSPKKSLIEACRYAYSELLTKDTRGKFNIILSNGYLTFAFIHFRPFYFLHREKDLGDVALVSTLKLPDTEDWVEMNPGPDKSARMLVFSGQTLIFNGDIPR